MEPCEIPSRPSCRHRMASVHGRTTRVERFLPSRERIVSRLSSYLRFHWRLFNVLARLFGIMTVCVGAVFVAAGVYFFAEPNAAKGIETGELPANWLYLISGVVVVGIGVGALGIQPFRPDLGDAAWTTGWKRRGPTDRGTLRSWWTGNPKRGSDSGEKSCLSWPCRGRYRERTKTHLR